MTDRTATAPGNGRERGVSQFLFIVIALAIIIGGLWSLYMNDAPYHPEVSQGNAGITVATD